MSENNIVNIGQKPTNLKGGLMKSRAKRIVGSVVAGLLLGGVAGAASASTLATLSFVGIDSADAAFVAAGSPIHSSLLSSTLHNVYAGEVIYFELRISANTAKGQSFTNASVPASGTWGTNEGINSLGTISLDQVAASGLTGSFDSANITETDSWTRATGPVPGNNTARPDGGFDLQGIRLARGTATYTEVVGTGTKKVTYTHWANVLPIAGAMTPAVNPSPNPDDILLNGYFTVAAAANNGSAQLNGDMVIESNSGANAATTSGFKLANNPYAPSLDISDGTLNKTTGVHSAPPVGNDPPFVWQPLTLNGPVVTQGVPTPSALLGGALLGALVAYRRWKRA